MGAVSSRSEITVQKWPISDRASVEATETSDDDEEEDLDIGIPRRRPLSHAFPPTPTVEEEQPQAIATSLPPFSDDEPPATEAAEEEEEETKPPVPQLHITEIKEESDQDENVKYTNDMDEIQKLEQTFDSLGIPSPSSLPAEESSLPVVSSVEDEVRQRWQNMARLGVGTPDFKKMYSKAMDAAPAATRISRSAAGTQIYLKVPTNTATSIENNGNSKSAPITLIQHKNGSSSSYSDSEEWTYQKSSVDGFDPEKFKKINRKESPELQKAQKVSSSSILEEETEDHNDVPNYDPLEQQILESIEKEYMS